MRIVIDLQSRQSPSRMRGIGRYSLALTRHLARRAPGHDVFVVLNGAMPHTDAVRAELEDVLPPDRILVWSQPSGVAAVGGSRWRSRAAEHVRERFLQSLEPDIVHVSSLFEGLGDDATTSIDTIGAGIPTAATLYDLIPLVRRDVYLTNPAIADWYQRKLLSLRRADLCLAISEHSRREAIERLGLPEDRIRVISSAVDPKFRAPALIDESLVRRRFGIVRPFVLYTGTIEPHKNIDGLFTAYAKLPEGLRRDHQLVIVCRLDEHNLVRLNAAARRAGLVQGDYVLTGHVSDEDLIGLYSLCRLFVFPSLHEGFGLPVLEAMGCGAPVIASGTTSLPEVVGRRDALFDPASPDAIAGAMARALADEGFLRELRRHGLERARLFSWAETARRALDAFEEMHDRRRERIPAPTRPRRPRLAFVSPLKPEPGALAEHAAAFLPELANHYEIECVVSQEGVEDPFARACLPIRSAEWFAGNGGHYDRVVYNLGADPEALGWMTGLLGRWPGTVMLQDFHLGAALRQQEASAGQPGPWTTALYRSHGWKALLDRSRADDMEAFAAKYPCSGGIGQDALGVITFFMDGRDLAMSWFGQEAARSWVSLRPSDPEIDQVPGTQAEHPFGPGASGSRPGGPYPVRLARLCRNAIEDHAANSRLARLDRLTLDIAELAAPDAPTPPDWEAVLSSIAANKPATAGDRQLLIDVSELVQRDAGTGIQRVTKNIAIGLIGDPPPGFRAEPVFDDGTGTFRYARTLTAKLLGLPEILLGDDPVDAQPGDVFLGLDLIAHQIAGRVDANRRLRDRGVRFYYVVYDVLPLAHPEWFPPFPLFRTWLRQIGSEADGLVCISRSVAAQVADLLPGLEVERESRLSIGHFHLGADIAHGGQAPSDEVRRVLESGGPVFLTVGTVEPRKGHAQCLDAFERLWERGVSAQLVIVGKQGWMVDDLVEKLRNHPEAGARLHWLERADDADLAALYEGSGCFLAASRDEGFGLPLIEAAKHGLPILARDIPVFREIAGDHASYFSGDDGKALAGAVLSWIEEQSAGRIPGSGGIRWMTWEESARRLRDVIFGGRWDASWKPGEPPARLASPGMPDDGVPARSGAAGTTMRFDGSTVSGGSYKNA